MSEQHATVAGPTPTESEAGWFREHDRNWVRKLCGEAEDDTTTGGEAAGSGRMATMKHATVADLAAIGAHPPPIEAIEAFFAEVLAAERELYGALRLPAGWSSFHAASVHQTIARDAARRILARITGRPRTP